jgi:carbon-monoxide dehydrogenase large subunit
MPVDAYRGAGRPEANYLVERLVDAAARELNIDRIELRRRNMVPPSAMPHSTPVGKTYDSGDFQVVLDAALTKMDYAGFAARRAAAAARGKRRGLGLAYYLEATGGDPTERAEIRFADDGFVDVYVGTQSTGQGHETAYVQLTANRLGIDGEKIRVRQGDTDTIPVGGGTGGARSLYSEGQAIVKTADSVIEKGKQAAAEALEAAVADIRFSPTARSRSSAPIAASTSSASPRRSGGKQQRGSRRSRSIPPRSPRSINHTFPNGCHMAEVEIDPETGVTTVVRYIVCDDFGTTVNPLIVRGQVAGGVAQGLGQAILEHTVFDPDSGQLLSGSFMDYALPRADDLPDVEVDLLEIPCATNPLGVKGAGEAGAVGSPPALINAIIDALSVDGVTSIDMPATSERVWRALAAAYEGFCGAETWRVPDKISRNASKISTRPVQSLPGIPSRKRHSLASSNGATTSGAGTPGRKNFRSKKIAFVNAMNDAARDLGVEKTNKDSQDVRTLNGALAGTSFPQWHTFRCFQKVLFPGVTDGLGGADEALACQEFTQSMARRRRASNRRVSWPGRPGQLPAHDS